MNNLREVNDDILKDWLEFREETFLCQLSDKDYKYSLNFDKFCEKILRNVSKDIKVNTKITKKGKIIFTNLGNKFYPELLLIFSI